MERETFFYAYEGQYKLHFGVDLIDMYKENQIKKFENHISNIYLYPDEISTILQDYKVDVRGDVHFSGGQNDMRYFCMRTKRNFEGLISGFGNSRVALLCGHYKITNEYTQDVKGLLQSVYKPVNQIRWITVVLSNFYNEPFERTDIDLIQLLLNKLEKAKGLKMGLCFPTKTNGIMEMIPT